MSRYTLIRPPRARGAVTRLDVSASAAWEALARDRAASPAWREADAALAARGEETIDLNHNGGTPQ